MELLACKPLFYTQTGHAKPVDAFMKGLISAWNHDILLKNQPLLIQFVAMLHTFYIETEGNAKKMAYKIERSACFSSII